ncbi:ATP-binding protein [Aquimarina sp. W85]|uniref:sensor histidine kinase n=1 Tax=Aquimarina rhodophyticola TaxID=3342246 RepID=UPI00366E87B1
MNSLLARQIRKLLKDTETVEIQSFLEAINRSYENFEDQIAMLHRAMTISSQELYDANMQLKSEANEQRKVIDSLKSISSLLEYTKVTTSDGESPSKELSGIELANLIKKQATQIAEGEVQKNKILKELERSNQELRDYAHVVSHDLKSPLRTINTLINWIQQDAIDSLDKNTQKNLSLINDNVEKMDNLINGILEYSVIDKKKNITDPVDLNNLVSEILSLTHIPNHIEIKTLTKLPKIKADPARLKQVFENLITNAITSIDKSKGIITITSNTSENFYNFSITDNGKGIPAKYHTKIFEIFQSLENSKKSTGIGLSIVKKVIDYYQGEISIESTPTVGTTFNFSLKKTYD